MIELNDVIERLTILNIEDKHIPTVNAILTLPYAQYKPLVIAIAENKIVLDDFNSILDMYVRRVRVSAGFDNSKNITSPDPIARNAFLKLSGGKPDNILIKNNYDRSAIQFQVVSLFNEENSLKLSLSLGEDIYVETVNHIITSLYNNITITDSDAAYAQRTQITISEMKKRKQFLYGEILKNGK